jgi:pimeloyl-ACP methyl ester carboxylesterase
LVTARRRHELAQDDLDELVRHCFAEGFAEACPVAFPEQGAKLDFIEDSGHLTALERPERPERVNKIMKAWLA